MPCPTRKRRPATRRPDPILTGFDPTLVSAAFVGVVIAATGHAWLKRLMPPVVTGARA